MRATLADFIASIPNLLSTVAVEKFTHEHRAVTYSPREVAERIAAALQSGLRERGYPMGWMRSGTTRRSRASAFGCSAKGSVSSSTTSRGGRTASSSLQRVCVSSDHRTDRRLRTSVHTSS